MSICDLPCDANLVKQKALELIDELKRVFKYFDESRIKEIKIEEYELTPEGIPRGIYHFSSGNLILYCINCKICIETLIHEIIHSNSYLRRRDMYMEGLTEFLTLYYLTKEHKECLDHRFTDYICQINKEYEIYANFWANLATKIGVDELWKYYTRGGFTELDQLLLKGIFDASAEIVKKYGIKWKDLRDVLEGLSQ